MGWVVAVDDVLAEARPHRRRAERHRARRAARAARRRGDRDGRAGAAVLHRARPRHRRPGRAPATRAASPGSRSPATPRACGRGSAAPSCPVRVDAHGEPAAARRRHRRPRAALTAAHRRPARTPARGRAARPRAAVHAPRTAAAAALGRRRAAAGAGAQVARAAARRRAARGIPSAVVRRRPACEQSPASRGSTRTPRSRRRARARMRTRLGPAAIALAVARAGRRRSSCRPGRGGARRPSMSSRSTPSSTSKRSVWRSWTCGCATTPRARADRVELEVRAVRRRRASRSPRG